MKRARLFAIVVGAWLATSCNNQSPTGPSPASAPPPTTSLGVSGPISSLGPSIEWRCLTGSPLGVLGPFMPAPDLDCARALQDFRASGAGQSLALPEIAALVAPGAPSNLTSSVSGSTVNLQWAPPVAGDPPASYVIEAGSSGGASNIVTFDTGSTATSLTATSVPAGTYYVRVRARNSVGLSGPSNEVVISVGGGPGPCTSVPAAPLGLVASVTGSTLSLTWGAASGATSYVLEAGSSSGASNVFLGDVGPNTSMTANAPDGSYYVRVRAKNACGTSGPSNEVSFEVATAPVLLLPPEGALLDNGCNDFSDLMTWEFDWTDLPGATAYHLYVKQYPNAIYPAIDASNVTSSFYRHEQRAWVANQNRLGWRWRVRAKVAGVWGPWTAERTFNVEPVNTDCP